MEENLIYHYCSLDTFLSIIKNKTLRLSNVTKSNDYKELIYILSDCEEVICDILKERFTHYEEAERYRYLNQLKLSMRETILDLSERTLISHAMCFSKNGDKLSQWRGYANDGCGVAIGFDRETLKQYLSQKKYIKLSEVDYIESSDDFIGKSVNKIIKDINTNPTYNNAPIEALIKIICEDLIKRLFLNKALIFKNPAFKEEDEVRLHTVISQNEYRLLTCPRVDEFVSKLETDIFPLTAKYDFFVRKDNIVSYFDICFNHQPTKDTTIVHEFIKKIVIGPKANISIEEMQHIMLANKLGGCVTNITKSKSSYR